MNNDKMNLLTSITIIVFGLLIINKLGYIIQSYTIIFLSILGMVIIGFVQIRMIMLLRRELK